LKTALAIFVKTPHLSPLKTRLASGIGKSKAQEFYALSVAAVQNVVSTCEGIHPVWAVAEKDGVDNALWSAFESKHTGDGCLGTRQSHIYNTLLQTHDHAILIGADAPQISPILIKTAINALAQYDYVFGPANDGGYYLMAGKVPIDKDIWTSIPWSADNTYSSFKDKLSGKIYELPTLTDIDTIDDLQYLKTEMPDATNTAQNDLLNWIEDIL